MLDKEKSLLEEFSASKDDITKMVQTLARKLKLPGENSEPIDVLEALQAEIDRDYETERKQSEEVEEKLKTLEDQLG